MQTSLSESLSVIRKALSADAWQQGALVGA
jgi:hypothetical protein